MSAGAPASRYMGGYSPAVLGALAQRSLSTHGAFFVPYLRADMQVLDCGCGPGVLTVELAERLPRGRAVGIDLQREQFQLGRSRARERGVANAAFVQGSLFQLPFPAETFQAVFAHGVLYHLPDPLQALAEMHRVLKPGGLIGIRDSDFGGDLLAPASPLLDAAQRLIRTIHEHSGGDAAFGRRQRLTLMRAGFDPLQVSASYDSFGTPEHTRRVASLWAGYLRQSDVRARILRAGWADAERLRALCRALLSWGKTPGAFYARARCEAVGRKLP